MRKLFYIILAIATISCSSRKVAIQKEDIQIEQVAKADEQVSIISESNETIIDTSSCYEEEFIPIDSTQPMVIDRKNGIFKNTRFKTSKSKKGITTAKKEEVVLNQRKSTSNKVSTSKVSKHKETERKTLLPWWWWILVLITLSGYLIYRRYKVL
jgi:hypothetical protein